MAAVAGAVADDILAAMLGDAELARAYVNNGGDIALHLSRNEQFRIATAAGHVVIHASDQVHGVATSGWRGRSFSLGIADSVTVFASSAAEADAAATMIANAIDLPGSGKVKRQRACDMAPDSDLRDRLVTIDVAELDQGEVNEALARGLIAASDFMNRRLVMAASLMLAGELRVIGHAFKIEKKELLHA
jgi:uncharacterized protein